MKIRRNRWKTIEILFPQKYRVNLRIFSYKTACLLEFTLHLALISLPIKLVTISFYLTPIFSYNIVFQLTTMPNQLAMTYLNLTNNDNSSEIASAWLSFRQGVKIKSLRRYTDMGYTGISRTLNLS